MGGWWREDNALWALFVSAFVSSTLLPGSSEAVLAAAALSGLSPWRLLWVATLGNTLGGLTNWWIGRWIATRYPARRLVRPAHEKALVRVRRFGWPALLLSWLPVIGDPLCVAAGWLRINIWLSLLAIAVGKAARYALLLWLIPVSGQSMGS
ncbi:YqaA family protein [Thioalkalivibrio thiocyanodenitrificans]|uniref:YqaA family protein n=1 Tax=Thioalkalivibrio thiocyanodenitrificans TaxID=243063 RepID=UPI00037CB9BA|nr:YqaA family protein [Thioalkalivibrio thiocyanodenitrificans]